MIAFADKARGLPFLDAMLIPLTRGYEAVIDIADYDRPLSVEFSDGFIWEGRVCERKWKASVKQHTTYATCNLHRDGRQRELRLHRVVMCARANQLIDHESGDGLDCRRSTNLRVATPTQNGANWHKPNGAIPFRGVALHKQTGRFEAFIKQNKVKRHLGLFDTPVDAARQYDAHATELFGEFARLNFPTTQTA